MLATLYVFSHWQNFDGGFHRPGNKFKKQKRKAQRDASARGSKLEDEVRGQRRERRRSDTPGPRPSGGELRRGRSREAESSARYGGDQGRRGDGRYEDSSSDESARDHRCGSPPRRYHHREAAGHRVKQAPGGNYVPENQILDDHPDQPSIRPVNARHAGTSKRKPADYGVEDRSRPGHHSIRDSRGEAYSHLFGAHDTGLDFIDGA